MGVTELGQTAAFFAIILLAGFIAGRFDLLSKPARSGLTNLILFVTLPCTIVGSFDVAYDPRMLGTMGLTLLIAVLAQVVAQLASMVFFRKLPRERRSVLRYSLIVCNSGFFGMSIVAALFGGPALSLGAVYLIPQRFAMWSFGMACFTTERQGRALLKTTIHPCMIAVYIGFTLLLLQWELPAALARPIGTIGDCTMPLSMMLVGSILSETRLSVLLDRQLYLFCLVRLILLPGVVFAGCLAFGVTRDIAQVCILMAGMPAATTASLLALRYGADEKLGSASMALTTILFFLLLPAWAALFRLL